jgi:prepilin-type N-terminal cleavage/methylation domain-containing protein
MVRRLQNNGFSLAEVMMAAGILAIGFLFVATLFPVGVKLTAVATEQTIAPIVTDEAIAKIKLYADPNFMSSLEQLYETPIEQYSQYRNFADVLKIPYYHDEFTYPSTDISPEQKKYHWSALCRRIGLRDVHVIVFISRKAGAGARYPVPQNTVSDYGRVMDTGVPGDWPVPVKVQVEKFVQDGEFVPKRLKIMNSNEAAYINRGSTIIDDYFDVNRLPPARASYRVLKRVLKGVDDVIVLDRDWEGEVPGNVWVVPPADGSGRNPCVRVDPSNTISF